MELLLDFMYHGEVNVAQEQLPEFLKVAELLKVKGLADEKREETASAGSNVSRMGGGEGEGRFETGWECLWELSVECGVFVWFWDYWFSVQVFRGFPLRVW